MAAATNRLVSIMLGGFVLANMPTLVFAQAAGRSAVPPVARIASFAAGSLHGVVRDERGTPVPGVVISALGATTSIAVSDGGGRFEFGTLSPGPYLVRAHLTGFFAPRGQMVQVSPSGRASSEIALRRVGSAAPVLTAGMGGSSSVIEAPIEAESSETSEAVEEPRETVWRVRHARRGVLKEAGLADGYLPDDDVTSDYGWTGLAAVDVVGRAMRSQARAASSFFADTPFSGQVNLLTTGSFDTPQQLFSNDGLSRNIAYVRLGAPVGERGDWNIRGALTQSDISSWVLSGAYSGRASSDHRYDIGLSYATQRYDGANLLTLRDVPEGSRNVGTVYAFDSRTLFPRATVVYGASYARHDYLNDKGLVSPRVEFTLAPVDGLRISTAVARRALAPGAEEFLPPPADTGIWLPPQRTFSSIERNRAFEAERTFHAEVAVERDFGASTVAVRAFRQRIDDQLVTLFGAETPGQPSAKLGHYLVGNAGDGSASGCSAAFRGVIASRVHGSIEYTFANAELMPAAGLRTLLLLAPSAVRPTRDRIHDVATTIETEVPETATRLLVVYRVSNGFARAAASDDEPGRPAVDGRFDVQVRQSLPFMNFSNARWEMLLAVRNFFREAGTEQSIYDELLVVRPPKRVVGGVALRF